MEPQNGDHVRITTSLQPHQSYVLRAKSGIVDEADAASGGVANSLEEGAPENVRGFSITDRLTITLGASGYENITIPVHDTSMVGPGLSTWSHDSVWLQPTGTTPRSTTGFIRFGWLDPFKQATGAITLSHSRRRFSVHPEFGDAQPVEVRRVLQAWSDPAAGSDWNDNAVGSPDLAGLGASDQALEYGWGGQTREQRDGTHGLPRR